ncbi:MAG: PKD domain-containing protein [Bacillota bacterium]
MKIKEKIALLLVIIILFSIFPITENQAESFNNDDDFLRYLTSVGAPLINDNSKPASRTTFNIYGLIVYGEITEVSSNPKWYNPDTKREEYKWLGWDRTGELVTNTYYKNTARGSKTPAEWEYVVVDPLGVSWQAQMDDDQKLHMQNSDLSYEGITYPGLTATSSKLSGGKAKLQTMATILSGFSIYTLHHGNNGSQWYATLMGPPMGGNTNLTMGLTTFDDNNNATDYFEMEGNSITIKATAVTNVILDGPYVKPKHMRTVQAWFKTGDYTEVNGETTATHTRELTFYRDNLNPGMNDVKIYSYGYAESTFGDIWAEVSKTKTIKINVLSPNPTLTATISAKENFTGDEKIKHVSGNITVDLSLSGTLSGYTNTANIKGWRLMGKFSDQTTPVEWEPSSSGLTSAGTAEYSKTFQMAVANTKITEKLASQKTFKQSFEGKVRVEFIKPVITSTGTITYLEADLSDYVDIYRDSGLAEYTFYKDSISPENKVGDDEQIIEKSPYKINVATPYIGQTNGIRYTTIKSISYSGDAVSAPGTCSNGTNITLSKPQKNLKIDVVFESPAVPVIEPIPQPQPPVNKPPLAFIDAPNYVYAGDDFEFDGSTSRDEDGSIVSYDWLLPGANTPTSTASGGETWFTDGGDRDITLTVRDNGGAEGTATKTIHVLPPIPVAIMKALGNLKENRKVVLDASASRGQGHYPIKWNSTVLTVNAVSGGTNEDIRYHGILNGNMTKDVLFRKAGQYKVNLHVWNEKNWGTAEIIVPIAPDLAPVADFSIATKHVRNESGSAILELMDTSYSPDGDTIGTRLLYVYYDSDNNGAFDDQYIVINTDNYTDGVTQAVMAPWGELLEVTVNKPIDKALSFNIETTSVGRFKFNLHVREQFGQDTISEFVTEADYRTDDTFLDKPESEKTVEVINIAPVTDVTMIDRKTVDLVVLTDYTGAKLADLQSKLNSLKAAQLENNLDIKFTIVNNSTKIGTQQTNITMRQYGRMMRFPYYKTGWFQDYSTGQTTTYNNTYVENSTPYESCIVADGDPLPSFTKSNNFSWNKSVSAGEYFSPYLSYIYDEYRFYDPNNYGGTVMTNQISYMAVCPWWGQQWTYTLYGNPYPSLDNWWTQINSWQEQKTSDIYALDYNSLNSITFRSNAERHMLIVSDNTNTISYNKTFGSYYPFANLRKDNLLKYIQLNNMNLSMVIQNSVKSINLSSYTLQSNNSIISYTNTSSKQDMTLDELISYAPQDAKLYNTGNVDRALTDIAYGNTKPSSNLVDIVVATDYTGSKLTELNNRLSSLQNSLSGNNYDVSYTVFDTADAVAIGTGTTSNIKVFAARSNTIIQKSNETLACGLNSGGQIDDSCYYVQTGWHYDRYEDYYYPTYTYYNQHISTPKTINISNIKKVDSDGNMVFYLKNDGTLWVTGTDNGYFGTITPEGQTKFTTPTQHPFGLGVTDFSIGWNGILFQKGNSIFVIGENSYYKYGVGEAVQRYTTPTNIYSGSNITSVSMSDAALFIVDNGRLYGAGYRPYLGIGSSEGTSASYRQQITNFTDVKKVLTNGSRTLILRDDGTVWATGDNSSGSLGVGGTDYKYSFTQVQNLSNVVDIYLGYRHCAAKTKDGNFYIWGDNGGGQIRGYIGYSNTYSTPIDLDSLIASLGINEKVKEVSLSNNQTFITTMSGKIYATGTNSYGQLGLGYVHNYTDKYEKLNVEESMQVNINAPDTAAILNYPVRDNSKRYFITAFEGSGVDYSGSYGSYYGFGSLTTNFADQLKANGYEFFGTAKEDIKNFKLTSPSISATIQDLSLNQLLSKNTEGGGWYSGFAKIADVIQNRYKQPYIDTSSDVLTVIMGEPIEYRAFYSDYENDMRYADRWTYEHDETYFENSLGKAIFHNIPQTLPISMFDKPGYYNVKYSARDNPKDDDNFDSYRLWSKEAAIPMIVHRRPIAEFSLGMSYNSSMGQFVPHISETSYDLDHMSQPDRGIVEKEWRWKLNTDTVWQLGQPAVIERGKLYLVQLRVKDMEGAWSAELVKDIGIPDIFVEAMPQYRSWSNQDVNVSVISGVIGAAFSYIQYRWTNSTAKPASGWSTMYQQSFSLTQSSTGIHYLHLELVCTNGTRYYIYRGPYQIDKIAPVIVPDMPNAETSEPLNLNVNVSDIGGSGLKQVSYKWSLSDIKPAEGWNTAYGSFSTLQQDNGIWYLHVEAEDNAGNITYGCLGSYKVNTCKLEGFRVVMVRDLHLESYYYNDATGKFTDRPIYAEDMAVDGSSFGSGFIDSLTKGYMFEFEIDSTGFNDAFDTIEIEPHFYTCDSFSRDSDERELYWEDGRHRLWKAGESGHAPWKTIILRAENRTITDTHKAVWRGSYLIPGTAWAVPVGTSAADAKAHNLKRDIIVSFQIKGFKNSELKFDYTQDQWPIEAPNPRHPYKIGDVIRYGWDKNCLDDKKVIRNR